MGLVSSMRGYVNWGKNKGLNQKEVQKLIKAYEKETGNKLNANKVYYPNRQDLINKSRNRFMLFTTWYANNKNVL